MEEENKSSLEIPTYKVTNWEEMKKLHEKIVNMPDLTIVLIGSTRDGTGSGKDLVTGELHFAVMDTKNKIPFNELTRRSKFIHQEL